MCVLEGILKGTFVGLFACYGKVIQHGVVYTRVHIRGYIRGCTRECISGTFKGLVACHGKMIQHGVDLTENDEDVLHQSFGPEEGGGAGGMPG